jgi:hypothetical protein
VASPSAGEPLWGIGDPDELSWRLWDDGLVIYDARSDQTNRFDPITAEVFDELRAGARRLSDLAPAVAERLGVLADDELKDMVTEILRILCAENIAVPVG